MVEDYRQEQQTTRVIKYILSLTTASLSTHVYSFSSMFVQYSEAVNCHSFLDFWSLEIDKNRLILLCLTLPHFRENAFLFQSYYPARVTN